MKFPQQLSLFDEDAEDFPPAPPPKTPQKDSNSILTREIPYTLKRVRRHTIGLQIGVNGLEVSAPRWVSIREIERVIEEKRAWIERKLTERETWREKEAVDAIRFEEGGLIPYRGMRVKISLGRPKTELLEEGKILAVALPLNAEESRVREAVRVWLVSEAERRIGERLKFYSEKAHLVPSSWRLANTRGRWGSCTTKGVIRLCWRLIFFTDDVLDYVVVHELAHLAHMDHSESFWKTVEGIYPAYVEARAKLMGVPAGELVF